MGKSIFLFLGFIWLIHFNLDAQDKKLLDSLKKQTLETKLPDSTLSLLYYQISRVYRHSKFDSSFWYANNGITLAKKIKFDKGIAANLNGLSTLELNQGNYLVALKFALEALGINEKLGNMTEIAYTKNNIGEVYRLLRNYPKALEYYNQALVLNKKYGYKEGVAINLNNIGEIYTAQGKYELALEQMLESLAICKELKDKRRIALRYNNIGEIYEKKNENQRAKQYFEESLALNNEIGNKLQQAISLCNLAKVLLKEGDLNSEIAEKSYQIALSMKAKREISNALEIIVKIYEKKNQYKLAFQNYKLYNQYKDSINIEQADKQTKQIQHEYEIDKKEKAILVLELDNKIRVEKQQAQYAYTIAFGIGILLLILLALLQYRKSIAEKKNRMLLHEKNTEIMNRQTELIAQKDLIDDQKQDLEKAYRNMLRNEHKLEKIIEQLRISEASIEIQCRELETQNDKINGSIKSAYVIQQAILPYQQKIDELLPKCFVIYMPKDIVSGDFWWLNEIEGKVFLATVDCTGHGVAGAFMTMIGNTLLDKIIRLRGVHNPAEILGTLHEEIQIVLRQKENNNNNGMDMSIICLEKLPTNETLLTFSGAKHTIYCIESEGKITELKGTRKAIGGHQNQAIDFENHTLVLQKGSWVYTGSDGLPDQNNVKRKRFGEQRIKELILQNYQTSIETQKTAIQQALQTHMANTEQRDDILWIGFQV